MELKEVTYVLNDDYVDYMNNYLKRIINPEVRVTEFHVDARAGELDCYDDVSDFIFLNKALFCFLFLCTFACMYVC